MRIWTGIIVFGTVLQRHLSADHRPRATGFQVERAAKLIDALAHTLDPDARPGVVRDAPAAIANDECDGGGGRRQGDGRALRPCVSMNVVAALLYDPIQRLLDRL